MDDQSKDNQASVILQNLTNAVDALSKNSTETAKVVEVLAETARANKEGFDGALRENQARHEEFMRALMHETIKEHKQNLGIFEKRQRKAHAISVFVICASIIVGGYYTFKQDSASDNRAKILTLSKRRDWLENTITKQVSVKDAFTTASLNLRGIRYEGRQYCKNERYAGPAPAIYRHRLFVAYFTFVGTAAQMMGIFNQEVVKMARAYIATIHPSVVRKIGICAKGAANDNELMIDQDKISSLMQKSINALTQKKELIMEKMDRIILKQ